MRHGDSQEKSAHEVHAQTAWPEDPQPWGEFGSETFPTGETTESTGGAAHAIALRQNGIEALLVHHQSGPIVDAEETRKLDAFLTAHGPARGPATLVP